ncbi:hypothetical protein T440DRAFT_526501 [Plenodomus tracheiphilus IPT5]|uniref:Uncharacterized protein n=1 Tax=Plenodomus tracheiphilus IPT5 TaxID=1408161 RepID=A0A6A7APK5_9PLEO|nr:hypothetical protein T440DRAFT_526501 [Plenodomus tracheiphilus IPT5]
MSKESLAERIRKVSSGDMECGDIVKEVSELLSAIRETLTFSKALPFKITKKTSPSDQRLALAASNLCNYPGEEQAIITFLGRVEQGHTIFWNPTIQTEYTGRTAQSIFEDMHKAGLSNRKSPDDLTKDLKDLISIGSRYVSIATELGGFGALFFLPDIGCTIHTTNLLEGLFKKVLVRVIPPTKDNQANLVDAVTNFTHEIAWIIEGPVSKRRRLEGELLRSPQCCPEFEQQREDRSNVHQVQLSVATEATMSAAMPASSRSLRNSPTIGDNDPHVLPGTKVTRDQCTTVVIDETIIPKQRHSDFAAKGQPPMYVVDKSSAANIFPTQRGKLQVTMAGSQQPSVVVQVYGTDLIPPMPQTPYSFHQICDNPEVNFQTDIEIEGHMSQVADAAGTSTSVFNLFEAPLMINRRIFQLCHEFGRFHH